MIREARTRGDGPAVLYRLGVSENTLDRMLASADYGGWTIPRLVALIDYEAERGTRTIRDVLCDAAAPQSQGNAVAAFGGLINLAGRCGRISQVVAEALVAGRVHAADAARCRDEINQLMAFCRDQLLPDLAACQRKG